MAELFFESICTTVPIVLKGSDGKVTQGYAITKNSHGPEQASWVTRNSTLILGVTADNSCQETGQSAVDWKFLINKRLRSKIDGAAIIVSCDRAQGGLHSGKMGALAHVKVNDCEVDIIGLREIPQGHTDYFHTTTTQDIKDIQQIKDSGTHYSFSVPVEFLNSRRGGNCALFGQETVSLAIDQEVRWDIDYVVLVIKYTRRKIKAWLVALISTIFGAFIGVMAKEAWSILAKLLE